MNPGIILDVSEVSFRYPGADTPLLQDISLRCEPGKVYGLFGGNGSGKTSLLNLVTGFSTPETGKISYYGRRPPRHDALSAASFKDGLTRTFQVPVVVDELSVWDNLLLAFRSPAERFRALFLPVCEQPSVCRRIDDHLREFRLASVAGEPGARLSYGTRRSVSNVRALLTDARLVLMDEPFANLQPDQYQVLSAAIRREAREKLRTFIIVEHPPTHLAELADRVFFLRNGSLSEHPLAGDEEQKLRTIVGLLYEGS